MYNEKFEQLRLILLVIHPMKVKLLLGATYLLISLQRVKFIIVIMQLKMCNSLHIMRMWWYSGVKQ